MRVLMMISGLAALLGRLRPARRRAPGGPTPKALQAAVDQHVRQSAAAVERIPRQERAILSKSEAARSPAATCIDMGSCGECADDACPQRTVSRSAALASAGCDKCCSEYCECDGSCDEDYGTACHRCDTWVCGYCVVDGACHLCYQKMQGGVN